MSATSDPSLTTATKRTGASLSYMDIGNIPTSSTRKKKNMKKRRFSDEQIRSLESIFCSESTPELWTKQQLANKLGLQPRQIAIWFQNKRARSKSKQMEIDYSMLKTSFDTLASKFESLKKENQSLLIQLQRLKNLMERPKGSRDQDYDNHDNVLETKLKPNSPLEIYGNQIGLSSSNDADANVYFEDENCIPNMVELADSFLASTENGCSLESTCLLGSSSQEF